MDAPSNSPWGMGGSWAWETIQTADTIIFNNLLLAAYDSVYVTFRLAGFSVGTTTNGPDQLDVVRVWVSVNNGITWYSSIEVHGFNNATWSYAAGTGIALDTLQLNNNTNIYEPTAGGPQTTEGYSTVKIFIPDIHNQVMIRIRSRESTAQERWCIDDVAAWGIPLTVGLNEEGDAIFNLYPNPSNGTVTINCSKGSQFTVYSSNGCKVLDGKLETVNWKQIELPDGLYFVEVSNTDGRSAKKLIVTH